MSGYNYKSLPGVTAAAAITRFRVVYISGANQVTTATNATDVAGVAQEAAATGAPLDVAERGICIAEAGAAITAGSALKVDSSGRVITSSAGTDVRIGKSLEAASAAGDKIQILISRN